MSPATPNNTTNLNLPQAETLIQDEWESEVLPRLPQGWQEQAVEHQAFVRSRKLQCPGDLLRGLLAYVLVARSFRHLGAWSLMLGLADVSEADWRKRLRQAGAWLSWLFRERLAVARPLSPWLVQGGWLRIVLQDATHLTCPGPRGLVWRLHSAFDLLAGRLTDMVVTSKQVAEDLRLLTVQAGDLVITDSANGYRDRLSFLRAAGADGISRFSAQSLPLSDEAGHPIDLVRWLKGRHAPAGRIGERAVWITVNQKQEPVRIVCLRLTEEQKVRAQKRKRAKARDDKRQIRQDTLYLAGWLLLVTTVETSRLTAAEVLALYRCRWQIELFFKRIKQLLSAQQIRAHHPQSAQATIAALLLCWSLQEEEAVQARLALQAASASLLVPGSAAEPLLIEVAEDPAGPISLWQLHVLCLDQLRRQVQGSISAQRFRSCLGRCRRFLQGSRRRRTHWYWTQFQQFASPSPVEVGR